MKNQTDLETVRAMLVAAGIKYQITPGGIVPGSGPQKLTTMHNGYALDFNDAGKIEEAAWWTHAPAGAFGYKIHVPARVLKVNRKNVLLEAILADGSTKKVAVKPHLLMSAAPVVFNAEVDVNADVQNAL